MILLDLGVIVVGIVISYFLKDIQFLSLNIEFLNTGLINPDFLLILVIFFALYRGEFVGLWVGFFSGLLEDGANWMASAETGDFIPIIGIHALIYCLTGFILGKMNRIFDRYQTAPIIVLVLITGVIVRFLTWSLQGLLEEFNQNYSMLGPAFYTAIIAPIWFALLGWVYRMSYGDGYE